MSREFYSLFLLSVRQNVVTQLRECKQGELFLSFLKILSKPVQMCLKFSRILPSSISLVSKDIFTYLENFINVSQKSEI